MCCVFSYFIWLDGILTNSLLMKQYSDNFLKDFLKSNESKIDKVRHKKLL